MLESSFGFWGKKKKKKLKLTKEQMSRDMQKICFGSPKSFSLFNLYNHFNNKFSKKKNHFNNTSYILFLILYYIILK